MKLTFKGQLAVLRPFGFMDADATGLNLTPTQRKLIAKKNSACLLLSLKYVTFFSPLWLGVVVNKLSELAKQNSASFAICDYNDAFYDAITKNLAKFTNLSLFEDEQIAELFFGDRILQTNSKILLHHDNPEYRVFIEQRLAERGYEVLVASSQREFLELKGQYKFAISSKTRLAFSTKFAHVFIKDGVVIYRVNGLIDSNFVEEFDMQKHIKLLNAGFKFFAFWVNTTSGLNMYGANFLINLARQYAKYNAMLVLCGLNPASLSADLIANLRASNTLLYKSLQAFFEDDSTIYVGKKSSFDVQAHHITKNIAVYLPSIAVCALDILTPINGKEISVDTRVQTYDFDDEAVCGCALFDDEVQMRLVLALKPSEVKRLSKIFGLDDDALAGFSQIFDLFIDKILEMFILKGLNVNLVTSKIDTQSFFDRISKGAMIRLSSDGSELGVIFISR